MVDLLERLEVLLDLEWKSYRTVDYLSVKHPELSTDPTSCAQELCDLESAFSSSSSSSTSRINEVWREKICEWSYQVIDHFDFSREVVSVSIHYLDRFLAKTQVNKKSFQLVAMTTLYLAIKIYEPGTLCMSSMIELSRGYFSPSQMAEMEMAILRTLQWRLHPPTAYCFCKHFLFLIPESCLSIDARYEVLELARFLTEISVIDYYFVIHRPSDVALAALLNSVEVVGGLSESVSIAFQTELSRIHGCTFPTKPEVVDCRNRLQVLYAQGGYTRSDITAREPRVEAVSPVCVSLGEHLPEVHCNNETFELHVQIDPAPTQMLNEIVDTDIDISDITVRNLDFGLEDSQSSKENNTVIINSSRSNCT